MNNSEELGFPVDWKLKNLYSLTNSIKSGLSRRLSLVDIGLPVVNSGNLQEDNLDMSNLKYWHLKDPQGANTKDYFLRNKDILLNFINSISQIGKSAIYSDIGRPVIYTTNIFRIRVKEEILSEYLFEFLKSQRFMEDLKIIIKPAVNQASFTKEDLAKIFVPLPPLSEQKKISEILSGIDKLINQTQLEIRKIDESKNAISHKLFCKNFKSMEFGSIIDIISGKGFQAKDYTNSGIKLLRIDNVHWGKIIWDSITFLPYNFIKNESKLVLKNGDILLALNRPITQGKLKIARCSKEDVPSILYQRVGKIYSKNESQITNDFIYYLMQQFLPNFIENESVGSDQPFINLTSLRKLKLPIPELKEQKRIVNILNSISAHGKNKLAKLSKLRFLRQGISNDLMIGRKRVKV